MIIKILAIVSILAFTVSGCASMEEARKVKELENEVASLTTELQKLNQKRQNEKKYIIKEKSKELSELEKARAELERSLKKEIGEYKAKLAMTERGLVVTFLSEVFFDSGKAKVKEDGKEALQKVAAALNSDVPDLYVAVEGYTDNEPIKYSGWASNWELSSTRALAVLHYLIDECNVRPERLSANGYGEYKPVETNDTAEGRQKNRRVEIVIMPSNVKKVEPEGT